MSATSLTRPMFTLRKVFSSSFTISAVWVEETGITVSIGAGVERLRHAGAGLGRHAADDLGRVARV